MKICYVGDARSVHTRRWVRWFAQDHEVTLVRTHPSDELAEIPGPTLPGPGPVPLRRPLSSVRELRRHLREWRPDILHAHYINEAGWFCAASGFSPLVLTVWGSDVYRAPRESSLARWLNPWAARGADAVTCDSQDQRDALITWGVNPLQVKVVGWGVDRTVFHPDVSGKEWRSRLGIPMEARVLISPRQWLPNSHIEVIVESHAALRSDVFLVLKRLPSFEGGFGARVKEGVAVSPAHDRIRVVEEIPGGDLAGLYAAADVVVSLCETDGTPVSILEAMALGKAVVAFRNPSLEEWVSVEGGELVDTFDVEEVAGRVESILSSPERLSQARAYNVEVIARQADREVEMGKAERLYRKLTGGDGQG